MYTLVAMAPLAIWGVPLAALAFGIPDGFVFAAALVATFGVFVVWMIYSQSNLAKCWRCDHPISRNGPMHWPIVWWTRCSNCGVRHNATPEEARANPMAHLKPGKR